MISIDSKVSDIYRWLIVLALFTIWTVVFGIQYSFGIFFRSLQESMECSRATISLIMAIHLVAFALIMIPAGWAIERFSFRKVYSLAAILFGISVTSCGFVTKPSQLYFLYGIMGVAAGICGPSVFTVITRWFDKKRGLAMGLTTAGAGFGTLLISPFSNLLITNFGWRTTFVIYGISALVVILLCAQYIKNPPDSTPKVSDFSERVYSSNIGKSKIIIFLEIMKAKEFFLIITGAAVAQITARAVIVHIAPHAADVGISPFFAAMTLSIIGFGSLLGRIGMGFVQDRIGAKISMIICLSTMGFCLIALPFITSDISFFVFALLFGLAYGGDIPQVPALTICCFGETSFSFIYAFVSGLVNISSSLGPVALGYIFDVTRSYTIAFLGAGALLFFGVYSIFHIETPKKIRPA